ncbi:unnamed protein product [Nippostrongylus brasiliensis]|uniref:Uncharacterized protein n=1 Tax=Nippostrongylus brasiliensis TaxID=27835 RepID=A0A0N4Y080_NIPBR|nr:unnamed protein product [Nippostrongylus brasiliensis]
MHHHCAVPAGRTGQDKKVPVIQAKAEHILLDQEKLSSRIPNPQRKAMAEVVTRPEPEWMSGSRIREMENGQMADNRGCPGGPHPKLAP